MDKWTEWIHLMHMHPISNIELYDDFFLVLYCMSDALLHFIYTIQHVYSLNYWPFGGKSKTKPKRTQYTYSHIQFLSFRNEIFTFSLIIFRSHFYDIFFYISHSSLTLSFLVAFAIDDWQINVTFDDELSIQLTFVNRKSDNMFQPISEIPSLDYRFVTHFFFSL